MRHRPDAQPGILTRLDKGTSGLVVVALGSDVHAVMQRDAHAGRVRKQYLALVCGQPTPATDRIVAPLARDPADRRRVVVTPGGAPSETRYEVVASGDAVSLLCCELVTGRTHQIRVHMASRGWPLLGDPVYGTPDDRITRQALHAWRVTLPHPMTRQPMQIESPLPPDMERLVEP
jgi:23S rRNA pseudouridine1911/1915/1917 synthase